MKLEFFLTDFRKILKYKISRKSVQWTVGRTKRRNADNRTDMTKPLVVFRNFGKAPNNCYSILVLVVITYILKT